MVRVPQDKFRIFISHKHADAKLAKVVASQLEGLTPTIDCWVSGQDLVAGSDWNHQIKAGLANSHMLLLLFTTPARNWDWCLYEVGLFMRFGEDDITAVVCLFDPEGTTPGPLNQVQCVPAKSEALLERFLKPLCSETWRVADDWLQGALIPEPDHDQLKSVSEKIADEFRQALRDGVHPDVYSYHPCHRIVLDLSPVADTDWNGIPLDAQVVEGSDHTHSYTLALFRVHEGKIVRTWGELVAQVDGEDANWKRDLDAAFAESLHERLWKPSVETLEAWHPNSDERRSYIPVLYEITRRRDDDRPIEATILLVPVWPGP